MQTLSSLTDQDWDDLAKYLGNAVASSGKITEFRSLVQEMIELYNTKRATAWQDLQRHKDEIMRYGSPSGVDYLNDLTDEFVAEYGDIPDASK